LSATDKPGAGAPGPGTEGGSIIATEPFCAFVEEALVVELLFLAAAMEPDVPALVPVPVTRRPVEGGEAVSGERCCCCCCEAAGFLGFVFAALETVHAEEGAVELEGGGRRGGAGWCCCCCVAAEGDAKELRRDRTDGSGEEGTKALLLSAVAAAAEALFDERFDVVVAANAATASTSSSTLRKGFAAAAAVGVVRATSSAHSARRVAGPARPSLNNRLAAAGESSAASAEDADVFGAGGRGSGKVGPVHSA
jgi:hypothetical protein